MKSFQNKNAMTLIELIISVFISSVAIVIVMNFMSTTFNELRISNETTKAIDNGFSMKDTINRYVKGGYSDFEIYGEAGENSSVLLKNIEGTKGVLFGVINSSNKIQKNKIYNDNFIGYRGISAIEVQDILTNSGVIYNYNFFDDKIFKGVRVKDFNAELYNTGTILDVYLSIVLVNDEYNYNKNVSDIFFDKNDILEFNFNF